MALVLVFCTTLMCACMSKHMSLRRSISMRLHMPMHIRLTKHVSVRHQSRPLVCRHIRSTFFQKSNPKTGLALAAGTGCWHWLVVLAAGTGYLALAVWHWLFGTGYLALAVWYWLFGTGCRHWLLALAAGTGCRHWLLALAAGTGLMSRVGVDPGVGGARTRPRVLCIRCPAGGATLSGTTL